MKATIATEVNKNYSWANELRKIRDNQFKVYEDALPSITRQLNSIYRRNQYLLARAYK